MLTSNSVGELISGKVQAIDVTDVISFANTITGLSIPQPPNFLDFEDVELYICPAGTTLGTIVYPQGFSFQASVIVFSKKATIACSVGSKNVVIKGSLDDFTLGPLAVRGVNDPKPTLDIELSPSRQHIDIDGMIKFFDSEAAVSVQVDVMPKPVFNFVTVSTINLPGLRLNPMELFLSRSSSSRTSYCLISVQRLSAPCPSAPLRMPTSCSTRSWSSISYNTSKTKSLFSSMLQKMLPAKVSRRRKTICKLLKMSSKSV